MGMFKLSDLPAHVREAAGLGIRVKPARAKRGEGRVGSGKAKSALESKFLQRWELLGGPALEREQMIVPGRRWRFDFVHRPTLTAFETHGMVWQQGRHTRGGGFTKDRRKVNAATEAGWSVFELTSADLTSANIERLIGVVRERTKIHVPSSGAEGPVPHAP